MSHDKRKTIRDLYARHSRALISFLRGKVGREAAPDLMQETFVRALRYDKLEEVTDMRAFLRTTAANLGRDYARRKESESRLISPEDGGAEHPSADAAPDILLEASEKTGRLLATVNALPPKCRKVFIMRRFEDLTQQEIADRLGISRNMVEKHLRLALERCRAAIEED